MKSPFYANDFYRDEDCNATSISIIKYNAESFHETSICEICDLEEHLEDKEHIVWVHISGKRDETAIKELAKVLKIHPMATTYLCNPSQLARFEIYDSYQLLVMNNFRLGEDNKVRISPISILIGNNLVVTVQNGSSDPLAKSLSNLRSGNMRTEALDYLVYTFIDNIVASYHPVISFLGDKLEELEDDVIANNDVRRSTGIEIHKISRRFMFAYRALWAQKEALNDFISNSELVATTKNSHYLRRSHDYSSEIIGIVQVYLDMSKNLMNVYLSSANNDINEVMKALTIFVSIFAPFTIISSIYGMNFSNIPGMHEWWGMFLALGEMLGASGIILFIFRKWGLLKKSSKR